MIDRAKLEDWFYGRVKISDVELAQTIKKLLAVEEAARVCHSYNEHFQCERCTLCKALTACNEKEVGGR